MEYWRMNSLNNEDYCVICGKYIGKNNKMFCEDCEKKYFPEEEKDLTK